MTLKRDAITITILSMMCDGCGETIERETNQVMKAERELEGYCKSLGWHRYVYPKHAPEHLITLDYCEDCAAEHEAEGDLETYERVY